MYANGDCVGRAWSPIFVMQGSRTQQQFDLQGQSSAQMIQCCSKKGPIDIDVTFDKNVVTSAEILSVLVNVDMTKVKSGKLKSVNVMLTLQVRIRGDNTHTW